MSRDEGSSAPPPIGRRPVGSVGEAPAPTGPDAGKAPHIVASGPARLLIGTHILLLIQSALIVFSRIELGAARTGIAALTAVSVITLFWAAASRIRSRSRKSRRPRHDA